MFVLVPSTSAATVESIKAVSKNTNKVYFMEKYNQIVAKDTVYGVNPSTANELKTLVSVLGGTVSDDGTVSFDISSLNYKGEAATILDVIKALDAKIKTEMDKLGNSKTLNENWEFTGKIKYVAAVPASEGKDAVPAHIALVDETGNTELSKVEISDIIGNGVLKTSSYNKETGILTLTFAQASGIDKTENINLAEMLDINDVKVADGSTNYMGVDLTGGENSQAVFSIKVSRMADSTLTGLADAADVKAYVDSKATDLAITAEGDAYVGASVKSDNNKKVVVATNVKDVTYTDGIHTTYDEEGTVETQATPANISGEAKSLVDGAQATTAIKSYVDFVVAEEALRADAKVLAAVKALDKESATVDGSNVHVTYKEEDGIVTIESVTEDYATVTRVATTSTSSTPATNASLTVTAGDEAKLVKAKDIKAVADYAADKVTEEAHRVDKKITDTINGLDVPETPVVEAGEGAINFKYSETDGKVAINSLSVTYAEHSANTVTTGIVTGTTLNKVLADMWETYVDPTEGA